MGTNLNSDQRQLDRLFSGVKPANTGRPCGVGFYRYRKRQTSNPLAVTQTAKDRPHGRQRDAQAQLARRENRPSMRGSVNNMQAAEVVKRC